MKHLYIIRFIQKLLFTLAAVWATTGSLAQSPGTYIIDQSSVDYTLMKGLGLPNGKSVVLYRDNSYNFKGTIVNSNGSIARTFDYTSKISFPHGPDKTEFNAVATKSGNIFITYTAATIDAGIKTNIAKFIILDENGNLINSGDLNATNPGSSLNRFIDLATLSNGNVVAIWLQSDNNSGAFRIFTESGTAVTTDVCFAGPLSSIFKSGHLLWGNKVAASPNGGFFISFYYNGGNFRGMFFTNAGVVQPVDNSNAFVIDPTPYGGNYTNIAALGLANGNYVVAWS